MMRGVVTKLLPLYRMNVHWRHHAPHQLYPHSTELFRRHVYSTCRTNSHNFPACNLHLADSTASTRDVKFVYFWNSNFVCKIRIRIRIRFVRTVVVLWVVIKMLSTDGVECYLLWCTHSLSRASYTTHLLISSRKVLFYTHSQRFPKNKLKNILNSLLHTRNHSAKHYLVYQHTCLSTVNTQNYPAVAVQKIETSIKRQLRHIKYFGRRHN